METVKQISTEGIALIRSFEGCKLHTYPDQRGIPSIGIGHRLKLGESFPDGITEAQAGEMLRQDLFWAEHAVNVGVIVPLTVNQFSALVSFCFNVGSGNFHASMLLKLLNAGGYRSVPEQLLRWDHDGESVDPGLLRRRKAEVEMWNRG